MCGLVDEEECEPGKWGQAPFVRRPTLRVGPRLAGRSGKRRRLFLLPVQGRQPERRIARLSGSPNNSIPVGGNAYGLTLRITLTLSSLAFGFATHFGTLVLLVLTMGTTRTQ